MSDEYQEAYQREKQARLAAERLLENSSRELFLKNQELEEANKNLMLNQQTLVQSEKMASVGLLASGIAHEINNPLGYALSNLSVLGEYVEDLEALFKTINQTDSVTVIQKLIDDDNIQEIARRTSAILTKAGVDFGILGKQEKDSGNQYNRSA